MTLYLSKFLVKIIKSTSAEINTKIYTKFVNMLPAPNKYSTKLKLNIATNPQFNPPIMVNTKDDFNKIFIFPPFSNIIVSNIEIFIHYK